VYFILIDQPFDGAHGLLRAASVIIGHYLDGQLAITHLDTTGLIDLFDPEFIVWGDSGTSPPGVGPCVGDGIADAYLVRKFFSKYRKCQSETSPNPED
jgi:hypothetical protein